jgi:hypothetical protein
VRGLALGCLLGLGPWAVLASQQNDLGGAGMAGSWLELPSDARLAGMGFAGAGSALGLDSLGVNPAGLLAQAAPQLAMDYDQWVEDVSTQQLAGALPLSAGVAAFSLIYLNGGSVDTVTPAAAPGQYAQVTGSLQPWAMDAALAWAQAFGRLKAGAELELVTEQWGTGAADQAPALGLGAQGDGRWGLSLGGSLSHLGLLGGHALPSEARLGLAWAPNPDWRVYADGRSPLADAGAWNLVLAGEWQVRGNLSARAGLVGAGQHNSGGLCLGFSVRWQSLDLDYAYESGGPLGSSQQLGLSMALAGGPGAETGGIPAAAAPPERPPAPAAGSSPQPATAELAGLGPAVPADASPPAGAGVVQPQLAPPGPAALRALAVPTTPTPLATAVAAAAPNLGDQLEQRLRVALAAKDNAALLANLERLRIREPSRARHWVLAARTAVAQAALDNSQTEQGYGLLRSALHSAGEDPVLLTALVQFCANQGRRAEASLYAERALSVDPSLQERLGPWLKR